MTINGLGSKGRRTKDGHVPFSTSIPEELAARLEHAARERNAEKKAILIAALEEFFDPEKNNQVQQTLDARFRCLERRLDTVDWYLNVIAETQALYVKVWFSNINEIPEELQDAALERSERCFGRFRRGLCSHLRAGGLLVRRLPSSDWESASDGRLVVGTGNSAAAAQKDFSEE